jgi:DNA replication and repair protein RecF
MHLRALALTNYRNYVRLGLELGSGVSVFIGDNAQGKSNLLEAVHVLATTRSLRASTERELVNWQTLQGETPFARLEARVVREQLTLHVEILLRAGSPELHSLAATPAGKLIRVNGLPSRAAQLVGQVNVVLFTPDDIALVTGPPVGRRRYLDLTSSQVSQEYLRALQRYTRLLVQRNNLLRQIRERRQPRELLAPWDEELVGLGSAILAQRLAMVRATNAVIGERYRQLSGSVDELALEYSSTLEGSSSGSSANGSGRREPLPASAAELGELLRKRLAEVQPREIDQAVTLIGPHRDDFGFRLSGVDLQLFGSRGQQRLAVLALKLAELEFLRGETGELPILLLDDVLSELDPARRALVLEHLLAPGGQTLVSTTSLEDLTPELLERAALYRVAAGTVLPWNGGYNPEHQHGATQ